jgi:RNA polymerase sigma-70 factor (ECF subfamily)
MELNFGSSRLNRLASRMKKGDRQAAAAVYDELAPKVFGFCLNRVGLRHVAEDLTQGIFLKLLYNIETFDERKGRFTVWFWRLARNTLIDHYREKKENLFSDAGDDVIEAAAVSEGNAAGLDDKMEVERIKKFVGTLDEDESNLFELRYIAELPYGEISELLGKSEGALRVKVTRLKKKIHGQFSR